MAKEQIEIKALIRSDLDAGGVVKKVSNIQQALKKIDLPPHLQKKFNGLFADFNDSIDKINDQFSKGFDTKASIKNIKDLGKTFEGVVSGIVSSWQEVESNKELAFKLSPNLKKEFNEVDNAIGQIKQSIKGIKTNTLNELSDVFNSLKGGKAKEIGTEIKKAFEIGDLERVNELLTEAIANRQKYAQTISQASQAKTMKEDYAAFQLIKEAINQCEGELESFNKELSGLEQSRIDKQTQAFEIFKEAIKDGKIDIEALMAAAKGLNTGLGQAGESALQMTSELDSIKDKIKYFFSLSNAIQLVRQALRQTFEAAKELDAAMTETAVVTDFSVGDMWDMLPKYTKTAQKLGATTKGVYETLTLFYQQGLDTNEAMALGVETLEMARIAGMDYEEATSKMTAALRGFNMELNELSVQRVNDVYSELAAITAADTDQIATAMTKTASIANSANMEFETTAAFLSQIIETTQESAETAGTAMKTVIARFTELKKDPSLIGEVDGEIIDANKIETALNSIGVALRDNLTGQFRDLDDVFLDIAQKWEGLDTNTQRYIATIAAGSRQQSRFIAMMSDYERTMELVTAANNSAGSSQAQFDKTLDSMEAKLNQLKNTWQEFTLGLMDQGVLKEGIEVLNKLLTAINKLTDLPGILGGASKALLGFFTLFTGKKLFGAVSKSVIPNLVGQFTGAGVQAGVKFSEAMIQEFEGTKALIGKIFGTNLIDPQTVEGFKQLFNQDMSREALDTLAEIGPAYKLATESKQGMALVESDLMKVTGLTNIQAKEALAMTELGIPIDAASAAAKQGVSAATVKETISQEKLNDANEEALRVELMKLTAEKTSLLTKAKSVAVLLFSTNAQKRETAAKILNIGATKGATAAQLGLNAATTAFPIGWIVAGLAAVAAGLYLLIKWAKDNSLEGRLEKTEKSIDEFNEAISESQQRIQDLKQDWEALVNTEEELDKLTKGTLEWKQALFDANEQVLLLLEKYPFLKNYASVGENGQIKIDEEGYNQLLENQVQGLSNLQTGQAVEEFKKLDLQNQIWEGKIEQASLTAQASGSEPAEDIAKVLKSENFANLLSSKINFSDIDLENPAEVRNVLAASGMATTGLLDQDQALLKQNQNNLYKFDFSKLLKEGLNELAILDALRFEDNIEQAKNYQSFQMNRLTSEKLYASNLLTANASQELLGSSIGDDLIDIFSESLSKEDFTESAIKEKASTIDPEQFLREKGYSVDPENLENNLRTMYSELTGIAISEISEDWNVNDLKQKIAAIQLGKDANDGLEELYENFSNIPDQYSDMAEALVSSGEYTLDQVEAWFDKDGKITEDFERLLNSVSKGDILQTQLKNLERKNKSLSTTTQSIVDELREGKSLKEIESSLLTALDLELEDIAGLFDKNKTAAEEWAEKVNEGTAAQISYLSKLRAEQERQYLEKIQQAKAYREEVVSAIESMTATGQTEISFDINGDGIEETQVTLQELYEFLNNADWVLDVDVNTDEVINNVISDIQVLNEAFETLSGKTKYTVEEAQQLMKVFPGILQSATTTADGMIILNDAVRTSAIETAEGQIDATAESGKFAIDESITVLDAIITQKEAELTAVEEVLETEDENYARAALAKIAQEGQLTEAIAKEGVAQVDNSIDVIEVEQKNDIEAKKTILTNEERVAQAKLNIQYKKQEGSDTLLEDEVNAEDEAAQGEIGIAEDTAQSKFNIEEDILRNILLKIEEKARGVLDEGNYEIDVAEDVSYYTTMAMSNSLSSDEKILNAKGSAIAQFLNETRKAVENFLKKNVDVKIVSGLSRDQALKEHIAQQNPRNYDNKGNYTGEDPTLNKEEVGQIVDIFTAEFDKYAKNGFTFTSYVPDYDTTPFELSGSGKDIKLERGTYDYNYFKDIDEDALAKITEIKRGDDGSIDYEETLRGYYEKIEADLSEAKGKRTALQDQKVLLEAQRKEAQDNLSSIGVGGGSGDKDDDKWEYKRDYDENIKSQINAADKKLSKLEAEFEGLLSDENATLEDMIAKKLEMAAVDEEKIKLIEQQIELDRAEIEKLNKQHPEWADLVYVDENGAFQVDEDKVNAQGFNKEQGEEFEKWVQEQTAAHENLLSSSLDMVTTINEAAERLKIITNEFDQIYNNELKIEGLQRKRSKLETEYNELLEKNNNNVQGLVDNLSEQYDSLKEEQKLLEQNHNLSQLQLDSFLGSSKNQAFQDYYSYDKETNSFEINVEAMEKLAAFDEELYNVVSDFLETAMGYWEDNIEWEEKLLDNTEAIAKKQKEAEESFDNLQIRLYDEIINYMEQEIEAVEELYSSINDSNERILDSINESLAQQRQDRQNAETESEINDMRNRLAYLQMDTSGANQNEILNLQKQIGEKEQDYTDTLIDQKINELQKQNDFAAEQRERQIQLLQWEHEDAQLNGNYLKSANEALKSLYESSGDLNRAFFGTIGNGEDNSPLKKIFPGNKSVGQIIEENLLKEEGKMPTKSQTDTNTENIGDQVAKSFLRLQELRSTPTSDIGRTVNRVAYGLEDATALERYIYDVNRNGVVDEEDARIWMRAAVGLEELPKFATGGIADYTGPAWLDGTKSRPELVLNQRDTQNFLQLKDILASFMSNNNSLQNSAENRGDNYYEIHLNVEKIASDYDVEQLANKVKSIIAEDANSRGVNSIYRRR